MLVSGCLRVMETSLMDSFLQRGRKCTAQDWAKTRLTDAARCASTSATSPWWVCIFIYQLLGISLRWNIVIESNTPSPLSISFSCEGWIELPFEQNLQDCAMLEKAHSQSLSATEVCDHTGQLSGRDSATVITCRCLGICVKARLCTVKWQCYCMCFFLLKIFKPFS